MRTNEMLTEFKKLRAVQDMNEAIQSLALELHPTIWNDVKERYQRLLNAHGLSEKPHRTIVTYTHKAGGLLRSTGSPAGRFRRS